MFKHLKQSKGNILTIAMVTTSAAAIMGISLLNVVLAQMKTLKLKKASIYSLHMAEAGANYYRWHLAHAPEDYQDGTGGPGPYEHNYYDAYGALIGKFTLDITPPPTGTTVVTIKSRASANISENTTREIEIKYGQPSLTKYSYLTNSSIWFGENETVSGPLHSNGGIRMDGTNDSLVTSAKETYICTPGHGCWYEEKPGVWGTGPNYDLWSFPAPAIDFNLLTMDLASIKSDTQTYGDYYGPSNKKGYHIVFNNNSTYTIYKVTRLRSAIWQLNDSWTRWVRKAEQIRNESLIGTYSIPASNLIFVEDNLWIEGTVNGRVTVASAKFPDVRSTNTTIILNNNITYASYDGSNTLGLIAQKNIKAPRHAPNNLRIDAFLLAQKGRVFHNYYWPHNVKNKIEVYGGIITNKIWTWTWVNWRGTVVDGYRDTLSIYDNSTLFSPPPSFPTIGDYDFISWNEK